MKIFTFLISSLLLSFWGTNPSTDSHQNETKTQEKIVEYCNKYGVCVSYDSELFEEPSESESADGATFITEVEQNKMLLATDYRENLEEFIEFAGAEKLKKLYEQEQSDEQYKQITYKKLGKDFYVLSGYLQDTEGAKVVFYKKVIQSPRLSYCMVQYYEEDKVYWEPVCKLVASSFVNKD